MPLWRFIFMRKCKNVTMWLVYLEDIDLLAFVNLDLCRGMQFENIPA